MGASKSKQFSQAENDLAIAARALSHPARIAIVNYLKQNSYSRNEDLSALLKLSRATIHDHVLKLRDAGLIEGEFIGKSFCITLHPESIGHFYSFVTDVVNEA